MLQSSSSSLTAKVELTTYSNKTNDPVFWGNEWSSPLLFFFRLVDALDFLFDVLAMRMKLYQVRLAHTPRLDKTQEQHIRGSSA
jgi:hypothetical protein